MDPSELVVAASKAERPTVSYMTGCTLASVAPLNTWIPLLMATQTLKLVVRDGAAEDVEEEDVEKEDVEEEDVEEEDVGEEDVEKEEDVVAVVFPSRLSDSGRQRTKSGRCPIRLPIGVWRRATGVTRLVFNAAPLLVFSPSSDRYIVIVVAVTVITNFPSGVYAQRIPALPDIPDRKSVV